MVKKSKETMATYETYCGDAPESAKKTLKMATAALKSERKGRVMKSYTQKDGINASELMNLADELGIDIDINQAHTVISNDTKSMDRATKSRTTLITK